MKPLNTARKEPYSIKNYFNKYRHTVNFNTL